MGKIFISAEELLQNSFELGVRIIESGYRPTFILGVWSGGAQVGIAIQELLELYGYPAKHFAIRTSLSKQRGMAKKHVAVFGLKHVADIISSNDHLLIVDSVLGNGTSVDAIISNLKAKCRRNEVVLLNRTVC